MSLNFQFEWMDAAGARGPELRATWARFELQVDGRSITRAVDEVSRGVRSSVYLPLYPLAEWFVTQWWFLQYEIERRDAIASTDYSSRHSVRSAAEGFALPAVLFAPTGSEVYVEWFPIRLAHSRMEFTERGSATLGLKDFQNSVLRFARAVVTRLHEFDIVGTVLETELDAISELSKEEQEFCETTAALGVDAYAIDESTAKQIVAAAAALPPSVVREFFTVADLHHLEEQSSSVLDSIKTIRKQDTDLQELRQLKRGAPNQAWTGRPWAQGYRFARDLRTRLGLNGAHIESLRSLGDALQVDESRLESAIIPLLKGGAGFDAVVDVNAKASPTFAVVRRNEPSTLFAVCRAMFEYLIAQNDGPQVVTRSHSDRQKRNRAFAAEFILPAEQLRTLIPSAVLTNDDVDDLAESLRAPAAVIRHQLENHRLATVVD
jgi:hypothetical protein